MAAPLFMMALFWGRLRSRRWLRGREIALGKLRLHTTNLISGALFVVLGVLFIAYEGTSALSGFYESNGATDLAFAAEQWANDVIAPREPTMAILAVLAALLAVLLWRRLRRSGSEDHAGVGRVDQSETYATKRGGSA
jgi:drug/metabolite transporter (DMT)-like permease